MWWRRPYHPTAYDDDLEDQPGQGAFYQWVLGGVAPVGVLAYGVAAMVSREAQFYGSWDAMRVAGQDAVALGVAAVSAAVFMHCHYFWGNVYNQAWGAVLGKIVAAIAFIAAIGVLIVRVGVWGK